MLKLDKVFNSEGLGWVVEKSNYAHDQDKDWIAYAVCPKQECRIKLNFDSSSKAVCIKCGTKYSIKKDYEPLRGEVDQKYQGSKLWMSDVINLDLIPTKLAAEDSDDNYWVQVRLGQSEGKRTGFVYFGEKLKEQKKIDKGHLIIDLDDEQLRFDKGNMHPMKLLAKLEITFPSNIVRITKPRKQKK